MALSSENQDRQINLKQEISELLEQLPTLQHSKLIKRALSVLMRLSSSEIERLDWKILAASLEDLEDGFQGFSAYRHTRKVSIFGSARLPQTSPEYSLAADFARQITKLGFMVITGAGGSIMEAGNKGAGRNNSFGLNVQLPYEQRANPFIQGDPKLITFKYFFTRKLFFLRESDAIALFPGGFGTQDEAFETLTLSQTGKYGPAPLVLIDRPGGDYWHSWHDYICKHLVEKGLIDREDLNIYTITDNIEVACNTIANFYCAYHSSRYVDEQFVMRLNSELTDEQVEQLNEKFQGILVKGKIEKSTALPKERGDGSEHLPRLIFHFNQKNLGRLYQMIHQINLMAISCPATKHPEQK